MKRFTRLIAIVCGAMLLSALTPAYAGYLGRSTVGAQQSAGLRADFSRGSKVTMTETGTLSYLCMYLDGKGGASGEQRFHLVLYRDVNGVPGAKVAETYEQGVVAGGNAQWQCNQFKTPDLSVVVNPGNYWIMIHTDANAGVARYYYDGPANWYGGADAFADGAADPFGPGSAGTGTISAYGLYDINTFGRTTTGAVPSAGLRADFSRGSKFTYFEGAWVDSVRELCAYLDGLGGGSGSQAVRLALYRDANGQPGTKAGQSLTRVITAGAAASWVCFQTPYLVLRSGNYWIMLQSGSTANVVRFYSDGAANWFGGADAFADGASDTFGPGGAGSGTLSAYAKYTSSLGQAGVTTIQRVQSLGMTANYREGSGAWFERGRAVAYSIYMDGKGAGSGTGSSQEVRFALYNSPGWTDADVDPPTELLFVSKPVTIPAGMPPQWVTVPVPPYYWGVPGGLGQTWPMWLVVHSGNDAGIARYYFDGTGNYCSHADTFSDGTDQTFGSCARGGGTMSAFLTYEWGKFDIGGVLGNEAEGSSATPSSGLSANFIRGSKFTVTPGDASLGTMHAYLDGLGGGTGTQQVQVLVYDASQGNRLVAQSEIKSVSAGAPASWIDFKPKEPVRLLPGDYYLMLFTGGNAGVARNYGTPAANWLGVGASFAAGPPANFNPAPGVGSVSVLVKADLVVAVPDWD